VSAERARVVIFDFDGTLSLIRSGWMEVMVPMMVEILREQDSSETNEQLTGIVREFVGRLTGKQTMYQMIALAEEVEKRGGRPKEPLEYKKQYLALLWERIKDRVAELETAGAAVEISGSRRGRIVAEPEAARAQDVRPAAPTRTTCGTRPIC
jgi:phosphoglycolate phosphatase-like HAD superfamily hydrolase